MASSLTLCALTLLVLGCSLTIELSEAHPKHIPTVAGATSSGAKQQQQQQPTQSDSSSGSNEAISGNSAFEHRHQQHSARRINKRLSSAAGNSNGKRAPHLRIRTAPAAETILPASASHVLECEAGGSPPPTIHWLKDGKRITQSLEEFGLEDGENGPQGSLGLSFTRSRLYLDCAQPHDEGVYTCVAENPFTRQNADSLVKVIRSASSTIAEGEADNSVALCLTKKSYGSPARIHMWTRTRLELIGSEVRLFCRASGSPQPTITWLDPNDELIESSDKYQVVENGDLIIKELSWSDMGGFSCLASNVNGDDRSLTFLYPTMPEK